MPSENKTIKVRNRKMQMKKTSLRGFGQSTDGQDHINIHPRAVSILGKMLSFWRHTPFVHPAYGPFHSIEGFSHYFRTGCVNDELRYVSGFKAKQLGVSYGSSRNISNAEYKLELAYACYEKIRQNPEILKQLVSSELPFDSYYLFSTTPGGSIVVEAKDVDWIVSTFTELRNAFKSGVEPQLIVPLIEKYRNPEAAN